METNHEPGNQSFSVKPEGPLKKIGRILDTGLGKFEDYSVTFFYLIMIIVIFFQITFRAASLHLDFVPVLPWTEELARYVMAYIVFIGASIAAKEGAHIGIVAFVDTLPPHFKKFMKTIALLIAFIFSVILVRLSLIIVEFLMVSGQTSPVMFMPMWIVNAALPLGAFLMSIRFLQATYKQYTLKEEGGVQ